MSVYKILTNTKELIDKKYELLQEIKKINYEIKIIEDSLNQHFKHLVIINEEEIIQINELIENNKFAQDCLKSELIIQDNLYEMCNHIIVDDMIDISPELSKKIRYCSVCETTFE